MSCSASCPACRQKWPPCTIKRPSARLRFLRTGVSAARRSYKSAATGDRATTSASIFYLARTRPDCCWPRNTRGRGRHCALRSTASCLHGWPKHWLDGWRLRVISPIKATASYPMLGRSSATGPSPPTAAKAMLRRKLPSAASAPTGCHSKRWKREKCRGFIASAKLST